MAQKHRTANRAKAKAQRQKVGRHARQRHTDASTWFGAGALTVGGGAAPASGAGLAHADSSGTGPPVGGFDLPITHPRAAHRARRWLPASNRSGPVALAVGP